LIDPFSGPGRIQVRGETSTREGGAVLACRALADSAPFTHIFVGDIEADRSHACAARLMAEGMPALAFVGPAAATVEEMVAAVPPGSLCVAYLDPYNLRLLSFSILRALAAVRVDLAINFSTMDLQRNLEQEAQPDRAGFDGVAPGWRDHVNFNSMSKSVLFSSFFDHWRNLVSELGYQHSEQVPLVVNDRGQGMYRMAFFSKNPFATRIWNDVAKNPNRSLGLFD